MTGTRNPSRKYFTRNQPYFYKSVDNWEEWDTDEQFDRTFFIGIDDSDPEDVDVALYMIWGGKPVAVVGDKVLDTISSTVELAEQLETEIQSILEEVQELAAAVAQSEIDIEEAVAEMNELVDRCEGILEGAEAARDLAKDWATKMDGMVEEEGEPVDYSAKYYANDASESATAAAGSASEASDDADLAEAWATKTDGTVDGSEYSSKYYAGQSADSATTAGTKADEASASATLASKWATQLTTPVEGGNYSAKQYAQDAGTSATNAATSETNASGSASAASGSATAASGSATLAQEWAVKMDGQVASTDYSSKYYAGQSALSAQQAAISAAGTHFKLFQHQWFDYELNNDMAWLRADTFSWQDGTVYSNAYNHLVDDIDGVTPTTETVGGYTVTFYRAADGHKIVLADQETTVGDIYTATGVAWYYVLDIANEQFKLPRTKYNFDGLRNTVGEYIPESLPNITGGASFAITTNPVTCSGAFKKTAEGSASGVTTGSGILPIFFQLDASLSSSSYQNGAPVQQRGTQQYLYFYVGQFSQSAIEQTAGLNAELFNNKIDIDGNNVVTAGANKILNASAYATNKILEIPQDVKLEFNNGAIALKAGSKVYVPNGFESDGVTPKFDVVTIESDFTKSSYGWNVQTLVFVNPENTGIADLYTGQCYSGPVAPTDSPTMIWYDTANNLVKHTSNNGSTWTSGYSLPVGLVTSTTTAYTSVDRTFNGAGEIGSLCFGLPGIKVQGAFGVNKDGTYKLKTFTTDRVLTFLFDSNVSGNFSIGFDILEDGRITYFGGYINDIKVGEEQPSGLNFAWWNPIKGEMRYVDTSGIAANTLICSVRLGIVTNVLNGKIGSIVQNAVDSLVTSNALNFSTAGRNYLSGLSTPAKNVELTTLASGSGYTAPANGWFRVVANPQPGTFMRISSNFFAPVFINEGTVAVDAELSVRVSKGETVVYNYSGSFYNTNRIMFIYDRGGI